MHGKVLGAGGGLERIALALKSLDKAHAAARGQVGIFAIGLMAASPARVAEYVHVGRPEGQSLVYVPVAVTRVLVVLGARFDRDGVAYALHLLLVEHSAKRYGLREHRGRTCARHAMQRFVPPVVFRHAQPGYRGRIVAQLRRALPHRHARHQIMRTLARGELFVLVCLHMLILPFVISHFI